MIPKARPVRSQRPKRPHAKNQRLIRRAVTNQRPRRKAAAARRKQSSATKNGESSQGKPCTGSQEKKACCGGQSAGGQKKSPCDTPATKGPDKKEAPVTVERNSQLNRTPQPRMIRSQSQRRKRRQQLNEKRLFPAFLQQNEPTWGRSPKNLTHQNWTTPRLFSHPVNTRGDLGHIAAT